MNIIPICAFKDNYIWLFAAERMAWVVDPGDASPVIEYLNEKKYQLAGILLTHHHHDHSGGIENLLNRYGSLEIFGSHQSSIKAITRPVKENDKIQCGPYSFQVLEIPGHTLDHVAFYNEQALFCGDTLFSAGCGKVFEGTPAQMYHSLSKLRSLPSATPVYCGHEYTLANLQFAERVEPHNLFIAKKKKQALEMQMQNLPTLPSTLTVEQQMNPFLRCELPEVKQAAEIYAKKTLMTPAEVFAVLRDWKNK